MPRSGGSYYMREGKPVLKERTGPAQPRTTNQAASVSSGTETTPKKQETGDADSPKNAGSKD